MQNRSSIIAQYSQTSIWESSKRERKFHGPVRQNLTPQNTSDNYIKYNSLDNLFTNRYCEWPACFYIMYKVIQIIAFWINDRMRKGTYNLLHGYIWWLSVFTVSNYFRKIWFWPYKKGKNITFRVYFICTTLPHLSPTVSRQHSKLQNIFDNMLYMYNYTRPRLEALYGNGTLILQHLGIDVAK